MIQLDPLFQFKCFTNFYFSNTIHSEMLWEHFRLLIVVIYFRGTLKSLM